MAYQSYNITSLSQIIAHVASFAALQGWTVTGGDTYQHPTLPGAITATLSATATELQFLANEAGAPLAKIEVPYLNLVGAVAPTKLHIFTALLPQPYIALCVEFGFNLYRHLYFGYVEKVGAYNGGEVLAASNHQKQSNSILRENYYETQHQFLFNGHQNRWGSDLAGGVRVSHVNNTNLWRTFDETNGTLDQNTEWLDDKAFGGFKDGSNDGFVAHGQSPFLGANILAPIDLYAPRFPGINPHMVPLGRPAGVRMVNMQNLEPGAQIVVGGQNWRVFAAHSKQDYIIPAAHVGLYPATETSYYVGYAYPET